MTTNAPSNITPIKLTPAPRAQELDLPQGTTRRRIISAAALAPTIEAPACRPKRPRRRRPSKPWQPWKSFGLLAGAAIAFATLAGTIAARRSTSTPAIAMPSLDVQSSVPTPMIRIHIVATEPPRTLEQIERNLR